MNNEKLLLLVNELFYVADIKQWGYNVPSDSISCQHVNG